MRSRKPSELECLNHAIILIINLTLEQETKKRLIESCKQAYTVGCALVHPADEIIFKQIIKQLDNYRIR